MISMEEAAAKAIDASRRLYDKAGIADMLLEEIEKTQDEKFWDVTIGFNTVEMVVPSALEEKMASSTLLPKDRKRVTRRYKRFRIDAATGDVASMRMKDS